jgi:hypothetical protein
VSSERHTRQAFGIIRTLFSKASCFRALFHGIPLLLCKKPQLGLEPLPFNGDLFPTAQRPKDNRARCRVPSCNRHPNCYIASYHHRPWVRLWNATLMNRRRYYRIVFPTVRRSNPASPVSQPRSSTQCSTLDERSDRFRVLGYSRERRNVQPDTMILAFAEEVQPHRNSKRTQVPAAQTGETCHAPLTTCVHSVPFNIKRSQFCSRD